jgi:hypothetical protein
LAQPGPAENEDKEEMGVMEGTFEIESMEESLQEGWEY